MFDLSVFSVLNRLRCESARGFNHKVSDWSLSDWFTATMGELGEAANIAKKLNRVRDDLERFNEGVSESELKNNLADEIADTFIYLDLLATSQNIDLADAITNKFNRTSDKIGWLIHI